MPFVMRAMAFALLMSGVSAQYSCPSGYADLTGDPLCAGIIDETCSVATCCKLTGAFCSATNTINGNAKCKKGSDKNYFFDLKKSASVAASDSDDDFMGACCSKCSEATCADWQTVKALVGCGSGKALVPTNALPASDCAIPADDKYKDACCANQPVTCSATDALTGNNKCKSGNPINDFFDLKKAAVEPTSDSHEAFRSACCTTCSEATCADWQPAKLLVGCGTGKALVPTNALPASDCAVPTDDKYKEACCATTLATCSATDAITGNSKCKSGSDANLFFDLKKAAAAPASDSDADFIAACCSKCSEATCSDWQPTKLLVGCDTGKYILGTNVLPASDCAIPADDKYKEACCAIQPTYCSSTDAITGNAKCKAGSDANQFFDLKKAAAEPASEGDDDFRSACCSKCSEATCADWQTVKPLVGCGAGKYILGTNALASPDCAIPADDKYKEACCITQPDTCASTDAITGNAKCKSVPINDFFDLKKAAAEPASDSDDSFRGACCTKCSEATCADWQPVKGLVGCGASMALVPTNALPASDCGIPSDDKYKETCCAKQTMTCGMTDVVNGNTKCKTGSDKNHFFDLKKTASVRASDSDGDFKAACCSPCSQATCADWQTVKALVGCGTGKVLDHTATLPSSDCAIPTDDKYKEACCNAPMQCAQYDASQDSSNEASSALLKASPFIGTLVVSFLLQVGVRNL